MILFSLQFLLTNIVFSVIICAAILRLNDKNNQSNLELLLYSLGLGPVFTTLLLYYLFLFLPNKSNAFYLLTVLLIYSILFSLGKSNFFVLLSNLNRGIKDIKKRFKKLSIYNRIEFVIFSLILVFLFIFFLSLYIPNTLQAPLDGTDALKHGAQGKVLFMEKSLEYRWARPHPKTGFYPLFNNPAPSYPLILTWEKLLDSFINKNKELYFKSISTIYALLIMCVSLFWLSKKSKYLALLGVLTLLSGFSFFQTLITQHLDTYRMFFLMLSWIFLVYTIKKRDFLSFFLLGIFSGFAAFSHTIGAIIVTFNCLALFIFLKGNLKYKLSKTSFVILIIIAFGWIHYILDIFWGYGWIIFRRSTTFWG